MAKKGTVTVTAGRNPPKKNPSQTLVDTDVTTMMEEKLSDALRSGIQIPKVDLEKRLQARLTKLYTQGIRNQLEGWFRELSPPGAGSANIRIRGTGWREDGKELSRLRSFGSGFNRNSAVGPNLRDASLVVKDQMEWKSLSSRTIKEKSARIQAASPNTNRSSRVTRARTFFTDTGALKKRLTRNIRGMVRRTGVVKVLQARPLRKNGRFISLKQNQGLIPVSNIRIRLLPNAPNGSLPGLTSGKWYDDSGNMSFETALGIRGMDADKLLNPNGEKRPLMQPIFTYLTLFRAPRVLLNTTDQAVKDVKFKPYNEARRGM